MAIGNFGQFLFCLPDRDLIVVHRRAVSDEFAIERNSTMGDVANPEGVTARQFLQLVAALVD